MIYLVTGGSGSGKSAYAEEKVCSFGNYNRIYLATMEAGDQESQRRIRRHRKMREGKGFTTIERGKNIKEFDFPEGSVVLLECLSNLLANEMYSPGGAGENALPEILEGIDRLGARAKELVVVSNEIFSDLPLGVEMERYVSCLGKLNSGIARKAKQVVEVVYGIPVFIKG